MTTDTSFPEKMGDVIILHVITGSLFTLPPILLLGRWFQAYLRYCITPTANEDKTSLPVKSTVEGILGRRCEYSYCMANRSNFKGSLAITGPRFCCNMSHRDLVGRAKIFLGPAAE
jgi:hypothetical protein